MGALVMKAVAKTGKEWLSNSATSLHEIGAKNIDGAQVAQLGDLIAGKKCTMVVNVATNWGLTDVNYREMV